MSTFCLIQNIFFCLIFWLFTVRDYWDKHVNLILQKKKKIETALERFFLKVEMRLKSDSHRVFRFVIQIKMLISKSVKLGVELLKTSEEKRKVERKTGFWYIPIRYNFNLIFEPPSLIFFIKNFITCWYGIFCLFLHVYKFFFINIYEGLV